VAVAVVSWLNTSRTGVSRLTALEAEGRALAEVIATYGVSRSWLYELRARYVLLLVQDLHIRVIDAATGELLRELTLDLTRDYQPTGRPPGPAPKKH
jgi:hypothetical protein